MRTSHSAKAGVGEYLLLVVVLAFSVLTMHTLGHPDDHSRAHTALAQPSGEAMARSLPVPVRADHSADTGGQRTGSSAVDEPGRLPAAPPAHDAPCCGADPASVCVAVLGSLLLAGLTRLMLAGRGWRRESAAAVTALFGPYATPLRGPGWPSFAELSVLRI